MKSPTSETYAALAELERFVEDNYLRGVSSVIRRDVMQSVGSPGTTATYEEDLAWLNRFMGLAALLTLHDEVREVLAGQPWQALQRLGRSLRPLVETVSGFEEAGIGLRSLNGDIDTTTSNGRLIFHIFCALAEFERDLLVDRTQAGLVAARARGKVAGRKPKLSPDQVAVAQRLHKDGKHNVTEIAKVLNVSRATIYRHLPVASN